MRQSLVTQNTEHGVPAIDGWTPAEPVDAPPPVPADPVAEAKAAIADVPADAAPAILAQLRERVGEAKFRESFFDVLQQGLGIATERPRFLRVDRFLEAVGDPPPMLIDRLLPEKSLIALSGAPKAGKTYLAGCLAESLADGQPIWGEYQVNRRGEVALLSMEDGDYEIANRFLKRGNRATQPRPIHVCTERLVLSDVAGIALLASMMKEIEEDAGSYPVLLIVDTAREGLGIKDWNDPAEVADKLRLLRQFARENCTVLLVAHNKKGELVERAAANGNEISGSNAFTSSVDGWISAWKAEEMANRNRRLWLSIMGRGAMYGSAVVEMDTWSLRFRYLPEDELGHEQASAAAAARQQRVLPQLRVFLRLGGRATVQEYARAAGLEYDTARHIVGDLANMGYLLDTKEKADADGRGRRPTYYAVVRDNVPDSLLEGAADRENPAAQFGNPEEEPLEI